MKFDENKNIDVVGVGNALMDLLVEVEDSFLTEHNLTKGKMHLVSETEAEQYLARISDLEVKSVPGGASANTVRIMSMLGGKTVFHGAVGRSMYGGMYRDALKSQGVTVKLAESSLLTGNAITYITPDSERTFTVYLGAASEFTKDDIDAEVIATAKVVHLEAFQFEAGTRTVLEYVISIAKENNTLISLDLNDASLIERNFDLFKEIVERDVDILFCNEDEAKAFTGRDGEEALKEMAKFVEVAILKLGSKGSLISINGEITAIDAVETKAVDTTGAGDTYAAGFLYGYTHGWDTKKSGKLGSLMASKVIEKVGVDVLPSEVENVLKQIQ